MKTQLHKYFYTFKYFWIKDDVILFIENARSQIELTFSTKYFLRIFILIFSEANKVHPCLDEDFSNYFNKLLIADLSAGEGGIILLGAWQQFSSGFSATKILRTGKKKKKLFS